jgi:hypothetical protein
MRKKRTSIWVRDTDYKRNSKKKTNSKSGAIEYSGNRVKGNIT